MLKAHISKFGSAFVKANFRHRFAQQFRNVLILPQTLACLHKTMLKYANNISPKQLTWELLEKVYMKYH